MRVGQGLAEDILRKVEKKARAYRKRCRDCLIR